MMNAQSQISPDLKPISTPRVAYPSKRSLFNFAQMAMVMGYIAPTVRPFDGDAMLLGLLCEAAALWLYVMSRADAAPSR